MFKPYTVQRSRARELSISSTQFIPLPKTPEQEKNFTNFKKFVPPPHGCYNNLKAELRWMVKRVSNTHNVPFSRGIVYPVLNRIGTASIAFCVDVKVREISAARRSHFCKCEIPKPYHLFTFTVCSLRCASQTSAPSEFLITITFPF